MDDVCCIKENAKGAILGKGHKTGEMKSEKSIEA